MRSTATKDALLRRVTRFPSLCPHCHHAVSSAPAWLRILARMAPGTGQLEPALTGTEVAGRIEMSRQRTHQMLEQAVEAGALEKLRGAVYRRTWHGRQLLGQWKSAGWRG